MSNWLDTETARVLAAQDKEVVTTVLIPKLETALTSFQEEAEERLYLARERDRQNPTPKNALTLMYWTAQVETWHDTPLGQPQEQKMTSEQAYTTIKALRENGKKKFSDNEKRALEYAMVMIAQKVGEEVLSRKGGASASD